MKDLRVELQNWSGPKILMTIYPHPDDESMSAAGLLLAAKRLGWKTLIVCLTKGERGQNHLGKGDLKSIRVKELEKAAQILKVDELILGDFPDADLRSTKKDWMDWLADQLMNYQPGWVITYDHSGITGHPDHIILSLELKKILRDGIKLWWSTMPKTLKFYEPKIEEFLSPPTHVLDMGWDWIKKWQTAEAHRSQNLGKELKVPLWLVFAWVRQEWYHEVDLTKNYPYKFVEFKI